jgi:hypothetical protein
MKKTLPKGTMTKNLKDLKDKEIYHSHVAAVMSIQFALCCICFERFYGYGYGCNYRGMKSFSLFQGSLPEFIFTNCDKA